MNISNLPEMLVALKKFKQAAAFHNRIFKEFPAGGRELTFLGISKTENIAINWKDVELVGQVFDLLDSITSEDGWQNL